MKELTDEQIAEIRLRHSVPIKAITDAPNLRDRFSAACSSCQFFQPIDGDMEGEGMCSQYEFQTKRDWMCDSYAPIPAPDVVTQVAEVIAEVVADVGMMSVHSNPLKTISKTDDELRVGNYIILYGGRDLSGLRFVGNKKPLVKNGNGTHGEFFTKNTRIESPYTALGKFPVGWEHGFEDEHEIPATEALGYVDWSTKRVEDKGVFVERVLNRRNKFVKWVEELLDAGLVGTSSEAVPDLYTTKATGEIETWGLRGDTLTVQPADYRNLTDNQLQAMKALGIDPEATAKETPGTGVSSNATVTASNAQTQVLTQNAAKSAKEQKEMEKAELDAALTPLTEAVAAQGKELETMKAILKKEPAINSNGTHIQVEPDEKRPYKSFKKNSKGEVQDASGYGEFLQDVAWSAGNPGRAPNDRLIAVHDSAMKAMKAATGLNVNVPSQGGYFVQTDHSNELVRNMFETGNILSRVRRIPLGANADSITLNGVDETSRASTIWGGILAYWIAEAATITASKPKFREIKLDVKGLAALYYATDKLLRVAPALGATVAEGFREAMTFRVEDAILNGSGAGKPLGLLAANLIASGGSTISVAKETGQAAASLVTTNLSKMYARLLSPSKKNSVWLVNTDTNPQLDELTIPAGTAAVEPRFVNYGPDGLLRIKGREVVEVEHAQTVGTQGDIVLWDPSTYLFTDLGVMEEASSIHVNFTTAESVFRFLYYCDGQPQLAQALTPAHGTKTLSTQVVLDTRS